MPLDSVVRCRFLGHTQIEIGHVLVTPEAERLFALLTVLACEAGKTFTRDELSTMLWGDMPDERGKHNLRQTVYKARQLGVPFATAGEDLRLEPASVWKDWEAADGPVHGDWLGSYTGAFSDPYAGWLVSQRAQVNAELRPKLVQAMAAARTSGDLGLAERIALQVLKLDSFNEEATLVVAECRAMAGAKGDALTLLDEYMAEVGSGPDGEQATLPARVLRARIAERLPVARYVADAAHQLPLAGREAERQALLSALFDIQGGRGTVTWLWAPEGSGKTRLLAEVVKSATINGLRLLTADAGADESDPWRLLREACAQLLTQPGVLGADPAHLGAVQEFVSAGQLACTLAPPQRAEALAAITPPTVDAVAELLAAVVHERALVVVVDGVSASTLPALGVVTAALDRVEDGRAGAVVASRLSPRRLGVGTPGRGLVVQGLGPMPSEALQAVLESWIAVTGRVRARAHVLGCALAAEGNPLFALELLGQAINLADRDVVPHTVRVAIEKAFRALSVLERRVLCATWIADCALSLEAIRETCGATQEEALGALLVLTEQRLVNQRGAGYELSTLFGLFASELLHTEVDPSFILTCATAMRATIRGSSNAVVLFRSYGLLARCQHTSLAASWLSEDLPYILKSANAGQIIDEITNLRESGALHGDLAVLDIVACEVANREGRQLQSIGKGTTPAILGDTLPTTSSEQVSFFETLKSIEGFVSATSKARDLSRSHTDRARSAIDAIVIADNFSRQDLTHGAISLFRALRSACGVRAIDAIRGEIISAAVLGEVTILNEWCAKAESHAIESADIGDACTLLRIAAHAHRLYGNLEESDRHAGASAELAHRGKYWIHAISAQLCLASSSICRLAPDIAEAHLDEAARYHSAYGAGTPLSKFDVTLYRIWAAILRNDRAEAARMLRHLLKITPATGPTVMLRQVRALQALLAPDKNHDRRVALLVRSLEEHDGRRPDEQEDRNLYALSAAACEIGLQDLSRQTVESHLKRKKALGYLLTPLAETLKGTD